MGGWITSRSGWLLELLTEITNGNSQQNFENMLYYHFSVDSFKLGQDAILILSIHNPILSGVAFCSIVFKTPAIFKYNHFYLTITPPILKSVTCASTANSAACSVHIGQIFEMYACLDLQGFLPSFRNSLFAILTPSRTSILSL